MLRTYKEDQAWVVVTLHSDDQLHVFLRVNLHLCDGITIVIDKLLRLNIKLTLDCW